MLWGPEPLESKRGLHYFVVREADITIRRVVGQGAVAPLAALALSEDTARKSGRPGPQEEVARAGRAARAHTRAHPRTHTWSLGDGERRADASVLK